MGVRRASHAEPKPHRRHADRVAALRNAVFESEGASSRELRAAAGRGGELAAPMGTYLATVREASYRLTDRDIAKLTDAGHNEQEIFELTVAAAMGAALRRLEAGLRAVRGEV